MKLIVWHKWNKCTHTGGGSPPLCNYEHKRRDYRICLTLFVVFGAFLFVNTGYGRLIRPVSSTLGLYAVVDFLINASWLSTKLLTRDLRVSVHSFSHVPVTPGADPRGRRTLNRSPVHHRANTEEAWIQKVGNFRLKLSGDALMWLKQF